MKRILITAFEPFGEDSINPTQEILRSLPDRFECGSDDAELIKLLLPVSFAAAPEIAADAVSKHQPDAVISLGLAGGRAAVTPERIAINCMNARIPDNDGYKPEDLSIIQDGAPAYYSTLPVKQIRDAIRAEGVPSEISYSAGTYVCNCLMYRMLHLASESGNRFISGFIHVPCIDSMKKTPAMSLEEEITAIKAAVRACMEIL